MNRSARAPVQPRSAHDHHRRMLVFVPIVVILQLWLLTATMNAATRANAYVRDVASLRVAPPWS
jgi:Family of unknown function (DUF6755)